MARSLWTKRAGAAALAALCCWVLAECHGRVQAGEDTPDDTTLVRQVLDSWVKRYAAKDLDALMELYSDQFRSSLHPNKSQMKAYWTVAAREGLMDGATLKYDPARITIDGDTAITGPVMVSTPTSDKAVTFRLKRERGVWRIIGMEY